jgi:peptidoglycan/LPS O-acetylase OafA/YrhL
MPRPVGRPTTYVPGLDGLRALSVVVVVAYHLGIAEASGGFLGVGMFFTLSGYLITSILLRGWRRDGRVDLKDFWLRRARRLLPGVVLLIAVVLATTAIAQPERWSTRLGESIGALLYVGNWTTIASGVSYFDRFGGPGPLDHLWSLAIEEQFYLLWPVVFAVMMRAFRGRLRWAVVTTLVLAAASFAALWLLAQPGFDNTRAYEGTDTRAGGILLGAALAMVWTPGRHASKSGLVTRVARDLVGTAALGFIGWMVLTTDQYHVSLYRTGLLSLSLATAVAVVIVVQPSSFLGRALGVAPLRWLGERSYGIYLWHLPLIALLPETFLADQPLARPAVLVGLTLLIAELSWTLVENPIRVHGFVGALRLRRSADLSPDRRSAPEVASGLAWCFVTVFGIAVLSAAALVGSSPDARADGDRTALVLAAPPATATAVPTTPASPTSSGSSAPAPAGPAGVGGPAPAEAAGPAPAEAAGPAPAEAAGPAPAAATAPGAVAPAVGPISADAAERAADQTGTAQSGTTKDGAAQKPATALGAAPTTRCRGVAHIGDSTSIGLISPNYLPDPAQRIDAQYRAVGAADVRTDISGARSIVETFEGQPNAETATLTLRSAGFDGCWVFAMGTNEAANQAAGSNVKGRERLDLMMAAAAGRPVLWLTVRSLETSGPYADAEMAKWNATLREACRTYPNLRIYDWAAEVQDAWYVEDGIHFTSEGYAERGRRTAAALARAFPQVGPDAQSCVVRSA